MHKKVFSVILVFIMLLGICIPVSAQVTKSNSTDIYIQTETVPEEVYAHVKASIASMVSGIYDPTTITVGTPFKVCGSYYDLYYVVVYQNGKAVGTYRVYEEDGAYTGIYSESAEIITKIQSVALTTSRNPASIVAGNHEDLYAVVDSNVYILLEDPTGKETPVNSLLEKRSSNRSISIVNIADNIDFDIPNNSRTSPTSKTLDIGWDETQASDEKWCNAYCTASILRYLEDVTTSTISAKKIMEATYPNVSEAVLKTKSLSTTQADAYANTRGIDPVYTASRRTYAQVTSEIISQKPLIFICDNVTTGAKKAHAFVCRGYYDNNGNSYYSVWNPWEMQYEKIYTSNNTYTTASGNTSFMWTSTMYDWD